VIDLNPLAIAVAVVSAFVLSSVYYAALGNQLVSLSEALWLRFTVPGGHTM
jgi:hypothetical protein